MVALCLQCMTWHRHMLRCVVRSYYHFIYMLGACPTCGHLQLGSTRAASMTCERAECATTYCYHHSNAHVGMTCTQYQDKNRDAFKANRKFVANQTVHCPW